MCTKERSPKDTMSTKDPAEKKPSKDGMDIHDPTFARDPYPTYERLRAECPVQHNGLYGGFWLLTQYADVRHAAVDWRTFTSSVVGVTAIPVITRRTEPMLPIELDPPLHSRYRALVGPVFAQPRIEAMRPRIAAIAARLVDRLLDNRGGDLVLDFAVPLSVETMAEFAGLPNLKFHYADQANYKCKYWSDASHYSTRCTPEIMHHLLRLMAFYP